MTAGEHQMRFRGGAPPEFHEKISDVMAKIVGWAQESNIPPEVLYLVCELIPKVARDKSTEQQVQDHVNAWWRNLPK